MIYEYVSVRVIFESGIFWFEFNSGEIESGGNRIGLKQVWFGSGSGCPFLGQFSSCLNWVGSFRVCYNSGFFRLLIGLLRVFGSKSVHPISGVGSGMDSGHSVRVSGL